jgi:hypothetical protein
MNNNYGSMQGWGQGGLMQLPGSDALINSDILNGTPVDFNSLIDPVGVPGTPGASPNWLSMDGIFGSTDENGIKHGGWGGTALGVMKGLSGAYLGMKQYGLAKDQLKEGKRQFEKNYGAQRTLTNSNLEDRQRARIASNPGAYQSVSTYMDKNGVK